MSLKDIFACKKFCESLEGRSHNFLPENEYLLYMHRCEHEAVTIDSVMDDQRIFKLVQNFPTYYGIYPYNLGLISITAYIQYLDGVGYSLIGWYAFTAMHTKLIFYSTKEFEPERYDLWKWELVDKKELGIIAWPAYH